jgi:class 3 adenylate cyclase
MFSGDELRQLTVLFCDLVGSTELSQQLGPEAFRDILETYHGICRDAVQAHTGHVAQYLGDGVLAYFGYPSSHEDDAQNAVLCGLDILERANAARSVFEVLGAIPSLRLAAHTGRVLVGALTDSKAGTMAFGDTPNIASRIQALAEPGSLLVSETTWRLVDGYFWGEFADEHRLRGVAQPMRLWRVTNATGVTERVDAASTLTPFVARDDERATLAQAWRESLSGRSRFILIRGDPGIGKSRLVRQVVGELQPRPQQTLYVLNRLSNRMSPFRPVIELLEQQLGFTHDTDSELRFQLVSKWLAELGIDGADDVGALGSLLSIDSPSHSVGSKVSPVIRRTRTMDLLLHLLRTIGGTASTLLVVSDLHWGDASTLELLGRIVTAGPEIPLLGLLTARPEFDADWCGPEFVQTLDLFHLDHGETESLIRGAAQGRIVGPATLRQLIGRSGGVPLFAEELTRSLLDTAETPGGPRGSATGIIWPDAETVPTSVAASLISRLDRLGPARSTALLAATIGRDFSLDLLHRVSELDESRVDDDVRRLLESGLIIPDSKRTDQFIFKHALLRDAAYSMLPREIKRGYHARIAAALPESVQGAFARPDLVAHHMANAGQHEGAVAYWEAAAEQASLRAAHIEAAEDLRQALASLEHLGSTPEHEQHEFEVHAKLSPLLMTIYGWGSPEVEEATERALRLARNLGEPLQLCAAMWGVWSTRLLNKDMDTTLAAAKEVLAVAEAVGVPLLELGHGSVAFTMNYKAEFSSLLNESEKALAGFDMATERQIAEVLSLSPAVGIRTARATALWMLGRIDDADAEWRAMVELGRSLGHPPSHAAALGYALQAELYRYSYVEKLQNLRPLTEDLSLLSEEFFFWGAVNRACQGIMKQAEGLEHEARSDMLEGLALYEQTGARCSSVQILINCAEAFRRMGDDRQASGLLDLAEIEVSSRGELLFSPELWRIRGAILASDNELRAAEASYRESLDRARAQAACSLELRTMLDLHALLSGSGRESQSLALLESGLEKISQPSNMPEARRATVLLSESV